MRSAAAAGGEQQPGGDGEDCRGHQGYQHRMARPIPKLGPGVSRRPDRDQAAHQAARGCCQDKGLGDLISVTAGAAIPSAACRVPGDLSAVASIPPPYGRRDATQAGPDRLPPAVMSLMAGAGLLIIALHQPASRPRCSGDRLRLQVPGCFTPDGPRLGYVHRCGDICLPGHA